MDIFALSPSSSISGHVKQVGLHRLFEFLHSSCQPACLSSPAGRRAWRNRRVSWKVPNVNSVTDFVSNSLLGTRLEHASWALLSSPGRICIRWHSNWVDEAILEVQQARTSLLEDIKHLGSVSSYAWTFADWNIPIRDLRNVKYLFWSWYNPATFSRTINLSYEYN